jgi:hypothetical protein
VPLLRCYRFVKCCQDGRQFRFRSSQQDGISQASINIDKAKMADHFRASRALWDHRDRLSDALPELRRVRSTLQSGIGGPRDFVHQQWLQIASAVYAFKPDLIVELGRGYGNSTCAMAFAAKMMHPAPCKILSLCLATSFAEVSRPYLDANLGDEELFSSLVALQQDIQTYDFRPDIEAARRVFVFWDAHGYELAMTILARLYPLLEGKPHLTIVHDMADLAHMDAGLREYDTDKLWFAAGSAPPKYVLGNVGSQFGEGVALVDFLSRNGVPFRSAESSYFDDMSESEVKELRERFGDDFSQFGFWYSFSLNEAQGRKISFPAAPPAPTPEPAAAAPLPETPSVPPTRKSSFLRFFR